MNVSRLSLVALLLAATCLVAARAAPPEIERFEASTWLQLQQSARQPSAVVFTTTDCAHCPGAIDRLAQQIRLRRPDATLVAVVMDGGGAELLANAHYRPADRLFVFSGQPTALRHAVDPRWRGVTPYVALLNARQPPVLKAGPPSKEAIDAWLDAASPAGTK